MDAAMKAKAKKMKSTLTAARRAEARERRRRENIEAMNRLTTSMERMAFTGRAELERRVDLLEIRLAERDPAALRTFDHLMPPLE